MARAQSAAASVFCQRDPVSGLPLCIILRLASLVDPIGESQSKVCYCSSVMLVHIRKPEQMYMRRKDRASHCLLDVQAAGQLLLSQHLNPADCPCMTSEPMPARTSGLPGALSSWVVLTAEGFICRFRIEQELSTEIKPIPSVIEKALYCS